MGLSKVKIPAFIATLGCPKYNDEPLINFTSNCIIELECTCTTNGDLSRNWCIFYDQKGELEKIFNDGQLKLLPGFKQNKRNGTTVTDSIKSLSHKIKGLNNPIKRKRSNISLMKAKSDSLFMQETHLKNHFFKKKMAYHSKSKHMVHLNQEVWQFCCPS